MMKIDMEFFKFFAIGLVVSFILKKAFLENTCYVINKSPKKKDMVGKIFKHKNNCYKFEPKLASCSANKHEGLMD